MNILGEQLSGLTNDQLALLVLVEVWDLIWKSFALWRAARNKDVFWFVLLILINSAGLLPAFYLFYISKTPPKRIMQIRIPNIPKVGGDKKEPAKKSSKKKQ